ncbi:MAG: hypothetical protein ABFD07_06810 [Methanobacterium sp.]
MDMKLWNFVERASGIKNKIFYIENYYMEQDSVDGMEYHFLEINVEDADSETYEASYKVEANTKERVETQADFVLSEYFPEDAEIIKNY